MEKLRVGYAGVALSSYFAEEHGQYSRAINGLEALSREWDFEFVPIRQGLVDVEMAEQAARELAAQKIDFLLLQNATCAMGEQLLPLSKAAPRLGLWATPDPHQEGDIQLHSLVSMSHYASILKRYLRHQDTPFKWFYGHVEDERFQRRLGVTVRALSAIKKMAQSRIGWIGGLSPGFYNMMFDEREVQARLGTRIIAHELAEVVELAKQLERKAVLPVVGGMVEAASEIRVTDANMEKAGRLYLALKELAARNGYQALAVECWPKFQSLYGVAPCAAYGWLGSEDGMAVSCEGDVMGAASMLLLNYLTGAAGSATLLDLTAIDPDANTALMWHCGVSPRHFANADGIKWVNHTTLGRKSDAVYGVAGDQVFAAQETTLTYIGDDARRLLVLGSHIVEREVKGFDGTRGWFTQFELNQEPIDTWDLVNTLTVRGQEHHYAVGQGNVTSELLEIAAWLKMRTVERVPYRDYLQMEDVNT
jgi:L-fucose isomerase-like protein